MNKLFLIIFGLFSAVHLWFSWNFNAKIRKCTKPFLVLSLLGYYLTSTGKIDLTLVAALAFSWLGDVLLINDSNKFFVAGGLSFAIGHIAFVLTYLKFINTADLNWPLLIIVSLIYCLVSFIVIREIKSNTPKSMVIPMYLYLIANSIMNVCALMMLFSTPSLASVLIYLGALFFFCSDNLLFLAKYHTNTKLIYKSSFMIMLTYLLAQFLIVQGMLLY